MSESESSSQISDSHTNNGGRGQSENTSQTLNTPITNHKLSDGNYIQWSQTVKLFISGKGREDYLLKTCEIPKDRASKEYKQWRIENSMVMS